jgi:hypothetical protein
VIIVKERVTGQSKYDEVNIYYDYRVGDTISLKVPIDLGGGSGRASFIETWGVIQNIDEYMRTLAVTPIPMYRWEIYHEGEEERSGTADLSSAEGGSLSLWNSRFFERVPVQFTCSVTHRNKLPVEAAVYLAYRKRFIVHLERGGKFDPVQIYLLKVDKEPVSLCGYDVAVSMYPYCLEVRRDPKVSDELVSSVDDYALLGNVGLWFGGREESLYLLWIFKSGRTGMLSDVWIHHDGYLLKIAKLDSGSEGPVFLPTASSRWNLRLLFQDRFTDMAT